MKNSAESIEECLNHMNVDWIPFNDIYRSIFGFSNEEPTQSELEETIQLIELLLREYNVICLKGPEMKPLGDNTEDVIEKIRKMIRTEPYESYYYGLWFDNLNQNKNSEAQQSV